MKSGHVLTSRKPFQQGRLPFRVVDGLQAIELRLLLAGRNSVNVSQQNGFTCFGCTFVTRLTGVPWGTRIRSAANSNATKAGSTVFNRGTSLESGYPLS
jgi:hypothetical protein